MSNGNHPGHQNRRQQISQSISHAYPNTNSSRRQKTLSRAQSAFGNNVVANESPVSKRVTTTVPVSGIRFSQQTVSAEFSAPRAGTPIQQTLRGVNPLAVMTEGPGEAGGAPPLTAIPDADGNTVTTFDHRRLTNWILHNPDQPIPTHVVDANSIAPREWSKYTTKTQGEGMTLLHPKDGRFDYDQHRNRPAPSAQTRTPFGQITPEGPDQTLYFNTRKALTHMTNRSRMQAELTQQTATPGQQQDHRRAQSRVQEYQGRFDTFSQRYADRNQNTPNR